MNRLGAGVRFALVLTAIYWGVGALLIFGALNGGSFMAPLPLTVALVALYAILAGLYWAAAGFVRR